MGIEQSINTAVNTVRTEIEHKELATKSDISLVRGKIRESELHLQKEIAQTSNKTILWIGSLLLVSGLIQHLFK